MKLTKKIFSHGGSKAIDLPKEFIRNLSGAEVCIEVFQNQVVIQGKHELDTMESDPLFATFIQAVFNDAMKHPEKLHDLNDVWDNEWDDLLEGVTTDGDDTDE